MHRITPLLLCVLGLACAVPAAEIGWDAPGDITGELSDFEREGAVVHAWNGGGGNLLLGPGDLDLQFTPGPAFANGNVSNIDPFNRNGDINYETLLGTMTWAGSTATLTLTGLVPGNRYRVQLWLADTRSCCSNRQKTYDSGVATTQVVLDSGPPSQFVIGNFTADAVSQTLRCVGGSGADHPQYNALVLRDLGPPTPRITRFDLSRGTLVSDQGLRIETGESATLSWTVENTDWVRITPTPGSVADAGSAMLSPAATQTYQVTAGNAIGTSGKTVTVFVDEPVAPPRLSEILAANSRGIEDEDGDHEDWIEIHNPNPFALPMGAHALSDDPTLAGTWSFPPDAAIPAGGHLIVFASGKNRAGPELHTSFQLNSSGDYLALLENGAMIDQWPTDFPTSPTFPEIKRDFSYGVDSSGQLRFFNDPTPGAANGEGFLGFVKDTNFSIDRGVFASPQTVEITTSTPGASIRHTTDGSVPSPTHGAIHTGPLTISQTTVLRAIAYKADFAPTDVDTQTYIFPTDVIASDVMNPDITQDPRYMGQMEAGLRSLPIFSLTLENPEQLDTSTEMPVSVEFLPTDEVKGFQVEAGVTHFGGYYTNFDKKNFRLYFRKIHGPGKLDYPLFDGFENGIAAVDKFDALDLRSGSHDMKMRGAYLSNRFTDNTMLDMGDFNPHGRFVHLFINGTYWGQYHLRERWNAAMAAEYFGGEKEDYEAINGNLNVGGSFGEGVPYDGDGSDPGTPWREEGFDDSSWTSGPAQLGYGDGDEATVVSYGPNGSNKFITTWFRKTFEVADPGAVAGLTLELLRDDGAVVWLNGVEVVRSNLPTGTITITSTTRANSAIGGGDESTFNQFSLDPAVLHAGTNTLAVEIHQAAVTSSDISFDLRHPSVTPFGAYSAHLNNGGETLVLRDPVALVLIEFTYGDATAPDWPTPPDGGGPSMVLIHPSGAGDPNDPFLWRASMENDGNPGFTDATDPGIPGTDADGDGQPRMIELLLMSSDESAASLPQLETFVATHTDGLNYLHLRIHRDLTVDASLDVQVSEDLIDWSQQATLFQRTRHENLTEILEYFVPADTQIDPHRAFMRVRAWP